MNYPEKFITDVKKAFPDNADIHRLADAGNEFLGRYLDDGTSTVMSVDTILLATSLDTLQTQARQIKTQAGLYNEWMKLYQEQNDMI